ncbi:MAG: efflux RND transporter periplasmic adaptor subunit [Zoogloeaceae bacterium]|jgi:HlyD family secretion protein|nr:efflux RND transporter periplasmic adaptor subunit [Zoogloeaceae bacterium]
MKKISRKSLWLTVVVLGLCALVFFVWRGQGDARSPEARYQFTAITEGSLRQGVSANGTLNPVTLVNVGTQVSGSVKTLYADFNDKVEKDQILAELDDAMLSAQARQSEANLISARASLDLARANEDRMRTLFGQNYVSKQEMDQSVQVLKSAEAQVRQATAQFDKDKANLGFAVIRSPVSGVVVDRQVDVGQTVAASFQTPTLFKIAQDLSKMQIDSAFAEADVGSIKVGQSARFTVDAFPNRSFAGRVRQVRLNPTTTSNVVTYNVVVAVDNPDQILLPGMTAYVNIVVAERQKALLIPNAALRFKPPAEAGEKQQGGFLTSLQAGLRRPPGMGVPRGRSGAAGGSGAKPQEGEGMKGQAYVLRDGQLAPVPLVLGITDNRFTEIVGGALKAGDRVITGEAGVAASSSSGGGMRFRPF